MAKAHVLKLVVFFGYCYAWMMCNQCKNSDFFVKCRGLSISEDVFIKRITSVSLTKCAQQCLLTNSEKQCKGFLFEGSNKRAGKCNLASDLNITIPRPDAQLQVLTFFKKDNFQPYTENVALHKAGEGAVNKAALTDGVHNIQGGTCCYYNNQKPYPFVKVDLGENYAVSSGRILARQNGPLHLTEFSISVTMKQPEDRQDFPLLPLCYYQHEPAALGQWTDFTCSPCPLIGRYIYVWSRYLERDLVVCELEVFGKLVT